MTLTPFEQSLFQFVLWIVGGGVASLVCALVWRRLLIPYAQRTRISFDKMLFESMDGPIQWLTLSAVVYFGASASMQAYVDNLLWRVCMGVLYVNFVLAVTMVVYAMARGTVNWYAQSFAEKTRSDVDNQAVVLFHRFAKVVFFFIALTVIFQHFNVQITGILATAGVVSLAFALAAQDTLSNMMSGIILMFDRPFKRGDRITLPSGEWGDVLDIGIRSTKVLSFDQTVIVIPNAEIAKSQIVNHNAPDQKVKIRHKLGVAYGSDMRKVKSVIMGILHEHPKIMDDPPQEVFFTEFGDSSLNLLVVFWIADYRDRFRVIDDVNMAIKERFEAENIEIPFPQRDIHIRSTVGTKAGQDAVP